MAVVEDVALYALGYAVHEGHPVVLREYCLNTVQRKYPCSACEDVCPADVSILGDGATWKGCTNCNLCVTACPTQAVHESATSLDTALASVSGEGEAVVIACDRHGGRADVRVACLSAMPWELIATLALQKPVVLKVKACRECSNAELCDGVRELLSSLKRFFGADEFKRRILSREPQGAAHEEGSARRTAFLGALSLVKRGVETVADDEAATRQPSHYRAMLLEALAAIPEPDRPQVTWLTLAEDGHCRGCEVCERICPHGAINLRIPELAEREAQKAAEREARKARRMGGGLQKPASATAAPDVSQTQASHEPAPEAAAGPQTQALIHDASRCTQCGLCYMSCPEENIGGWDTLSTAAVPALAEHPISVVLCEKCGRPFKPQGTETKCMYCSRKGFF